jgi:dTMP kinase
MTVSSRGLFICVEGIDAVGKRTQSSILNAWLISRGLSTRTLSFPDYGTTIGREVKRFLFGTRHYPAEVRAMLYAANRWEKKGELEAILARTDATIVNRYTGSNLAYGVSNGLSLHWLVNLEAGLPKPDLVLLLDAPPNTLIPRRGLNKDTYEKNLGLQERARKVYLELAKEPTWRVIDATKGIEGTSRAVQSAVAEVLAAKGRTV